MTLSQDNKYIERCFELALKGRGKVSPNPLVGAVIVSEGKVVSEGWHACFGGDHAEAMAIKNARVSLAGATLYCNLEPCIHSNKKTPPCFPLVTGAGIKRVVLSNLDANPDVAGKSVKQMREQGIKVVTGVMEEKGRELNRFFFKHIKQKKPWVTLKIAQSVDAKISRSADVQTWLTGQQAKKYVHSLRAEYDAVLTGSGTLNTDNPHLNVREVKGRNPLKIILSASLNLDEGSTVFQKGSQEPVWIMCDEKRIAAVKAKYNSDVRFVGCQLNDSGQVDLKSMLDLLYKENIGSLLVEGGQRIFSDFLEKDLCDELIILQAPVILGEGLSAVQLSAKKQFDLYKVKRLGNDLCFNLRKKGTN